MLPERVVNKLSKMKKLYHDLAIGSMATIMEQMSVLQMVGLQLPEESLEAFKQAHKTFFESGREIIAILKNTPVEP